MKVLMKILTLTLVLISLCLTDTLAQKKVQVIEKTIKESLQYRSGQILEVKAEKSNVEISTWSKNYIDIEIKIIAKHPKRDIALADLENAKYEIKEIPNGHQLTNYFDIPKSLKKIKSNLKLEYKIKVPRSCQLNLANLYGNITLTDIYKEAKVLMSFGELKLNKISGKLYVKSNYADIQGSQIRADIKLESQKADIKLSNVAGKVSISNAYGLIDLSTDISIKSLEIDSKRTEVKVEVPGFRNFNYDLSTSFSSINVPISSAQNANDNTYMKRFRSDYSLIKIKTTYSTITIYENSNVSKR
ncbi:MAG: DUF4097 family beta strand repeat-containing protein [Bacteroidota bacterium]